MREGDKTGEMIEVKQKITKLEEAFQKPIGRPISFKFENSGKLNIKYSYSNSLNIYSTGDDVYVINGRQTSFEATMLKRGECGEICLRPDYKTIHEFGLSRADRVSTDSEGRRDFPAVVFSISPNQLGGGETIRLGPRQGVSFITEEGEEYRLPASTTREGETVVKTFREAEIISAEEEREEWLKWLLPNSSSG